MKIDAQHVNDAYIALIGQRSSELAALNSQICIDRIESVPSDLPFTQPQLIFVAGSLLTDACRDALAKAAAALGYNLELVAYVHLLSPCTPAALTTCLELIDPEAVVAVDKRGSDQLLAALAESAAHEEVQVLPQSAQMVYIQGRRILHLPAFAADFCDEGAKRGLWTALCQVAYRRTVY